MGSPESGPPRYVVGTDLTRRSAAAVAWALEETRRQGAHLDIVTVWPAEGGDLGGDPRRLASEVLQGPPFSCRFEDLDVAFVTKSGPTGPCLVAAARDAELLILGSSRAVASFGALSAGVCQYSIRHVTCPVAVVGPASADRATVRVLVSGMLDPDGLTFAFAVEQALARNAELHLVDSYFLEQNGAAYPEEASRRAKESRERHSAAMQQLMALAAGSIRVTASFIPGTPRDVMQSRIRPGDLLVLPSSALHLAVFTLGRCPLLVMPLRKPTGRVSIELPAGAMPARPSASVSAGKIDLSEPPQQHGDD